MMDFEPEPQRFVDEMGRVYVNQGELARGGQGIVYRVDGGYLVKVYFPYAAKRSAVARRLAYVKSLDLTSVPIVKPEALLRHPHTGYVMQVARGKPVSELLAPQGREPHQYFLTTGGLRTRLIVLEKAARALAALHEIGLIYCDVSGPNFLYRGDETTPFWVSLIDSDNLRHKVEYPSIGTRMYSAPEIHTGTRGNDSLSDCMSFALLAFHVLCQVHPYVGGDLVQDQDPEIREQEALSGRLPWIDHLTDIRNRSSAGIPRDIVLSGVLKTLFVQAFEEGLQDRLRRPAMATWATSLRHAAQNLVVCPSCNVDYYRTRRECPECGRLRPAYAYGQISWRSTDLQNEDIPYPKAFESFSVSPERECIITQGSLLLGRALDDTPALKLTVTQTRDMYAQLVSTLDCRIAPFGWEGKANDPNLPVITRTPVLVKHGDTIHIQPAEPSHPAITIEMIPEYAHQ